MALVKIRYKGLSDVRVIRPVDLEPFGIKIDKDLVWDASNRIRGVVVDGLSEDLLEALRREGTFTITEVNDDHSEGEDIVTGQPLDDTAAAVVDSTTGQRSVAGQRDPNADPAVGQTPTVEDGLPGEGAESGDAPTADADAGASDVPADTLAGGTDTAGGKTGRGRSTAGGGSGS